MFDDFNPITIPLEEANIIEASAGTGKTYSIALLALRLVLEKNIDIQKILLVTFTEMAAAELKERTAIFIRLALTEINDPSPIKDDPIKKIVNNPNLNLTLEQKQERLNKALLHIDEAVMSTIHSFCLNTLTEFAFETNSVYGRALGKNIDEIRNRYVHEFVRQNVSTIDPDIITELELNDIKLFSDAIMEAMDGKIFTKPSIEIDDINNCLEEKVKRGNKLIAYFTDNLDDLKLRYNNNIGIVKGVTKKGEKYLTSADIFLTYLKGVPNYGYPEIFSNEIEIIKKHKRDLEQFTNDIRSYLIIKAIKYAKPRIIERLIEDNFFTFSDLINQLWETRKNPTLQRLLTDKYDAIFVDEFQDTDKLQYEIFSDIFQSKKSKIVFYIGDPKQSIYAWRKADLNTYFSARNSEGIKKWKMDINFRSTVAYVEAMNLFFKPLDGILDPFLNDEENAPERRIEYLPVNADKKARIGLCNAVDNSVLPSFNLIKNHETNGDIELSIIRTVTYLLSGTIELKKKKLEPSNIGILVRRKDEGRSLKRILERKGIPSVILDDTSVFDSEEAKDLNEILNAVLNINKGNIQRALLTFVIGYESNKLESISFDNLVIEFKNFKKTWEESGVFVMMTKVFQYFNVVGRLTKSNKIGQRILSNYYQLIEILQKKSQNELLSPIELSGFLDSEISTSKKTPEEEYTQRIESDEGAIRIMTIHKCKGLEFDVVIAPYLSLEAKEKFNFSSFRDNDSGNYCFTMNPITNATYNKLFLFQTEQENRRLIYVALTRARFNSFLFGKSGEHALKDFISALDEKKATNQVDSKIITIEDFEKDHLWDNYTPQITNENLGDLMDLQVPILQLPDKNYHKLSYSFLAAKHGSSLKEETQANIEDEYDRFVFKDLERGAHIGNLLHTIFEYIDFTNPDTWEDKIKSAILRYVPGKYDDGIFASQIKSLVQHVLNSNIGNETEPIYLNKIDRNKRINELEFNIPIPKEFEPTELENLLDKSDSRSIITNKGSVKGMMNGLIDLFFEWNGKYYILDWKSNFLGDTLEQYHPDHLNEAMNENNYHLQYLIYTVAVDRYLKLKLESEYNFEKNFGGVIYLFLRGVRKDTFHGIFIQKDEYKTINAIQKIFKLIK